MPILSIEGNIGSGKSTCLKILKKKLNLSDNIIYLDEPVSEWINIKNSKNQNILELFYQNKNKYSFTFQILAYITRLRKLLEIYHNNPNKIIICERSIYTDKYVFAQMLFEQGFIDEMEWITYNYWFDTFKNETNLDGIIYINTSPSVCYKRVLKRQRNEENGIQLEYLIRCHEKHILWLNNYKNKIFIFNGDDDFETNIYNQNKLLKKTNEIIENIIL